MVFKTINYMIFILDEVVILKRKKVDIHTNIFWCSSERFENSYFQS